MEEVLQGLSGIEVYLDNICAFSKTWEDTLLSHGKVLPHLEANSFTVNPPKCEWAIKEPDWVEAMEKRILPF